MTPRTGTSNRWGTITVLQPGANRTGTTDRLSDVEGHQRRLEWRPADDIAGTVPPGYRIVLTEGSCAGSARRFHVMDSSHNFNLRASLGGLSIMNEAAGLNGEQRHTYHAMRLLFQHGPNVREALIRSIRRRRDLHVDRACRIDIDRKDVLPETLGLDASGNGRRWQIDDLIEVGQKEACSRSVRNAKDTDFIRLGLLEAARQNPIDVHQLTEADAVALTRLALFDLGPSEGSVQQSTSTEVMERFFEALHQHFGDSSAAFNRWFFDNRDGVIHQIAKRKCRGGPIERNVVRQVLLERTFDSLRYTGQCVAIQMRVIADAIDPPLDDHERAVFGATYLDQPYLARIPLVVLHRYLRLIPEAQDELQRNPTNSGCQGTLLRLLQYHADMIRNRRQADRLAKCHQPYSNSSAVRNNAIAVCPRSLSHDLLSIDELKEALIRKCNPKCECGSRGDFRADIDYPEDFRGVVRVDFVCENCGIVERRSFPMDEIRTIAVEANGASN